MKSIKKKTGANFLLFVANCGKILFYILILIYFFKYETIVRFDVYACLDCNCWKRITVQWPANISYGCFANQKCQNSQCQKFEFKQCKLWNSSWVTYELTMKGLDTVESLSAGARGSIFLLL